MTFAGQPLIGNNNRILWQSIRVLYGKKKKHTKCSADVDSINRAFIRPSAYTPVILSQGDDMTATSCSKEEVPELLHTTKITTATGSDSPSSAILRHVAVALRDEFISLINSSIISSSIPALLLSPPNPVIYCFGKLFKPKGVNTWS